MVFGFTFLMLHWFLAKYNSNLTPVPLQNALLLALLMGIFFAYFIPWTLSLCPSYIGIYDHVICRAIGNNVAHWELKDIDRCEFTSIHNAGISHSVLIIHTNNAIQFALAIPPEVVEQAKQILLERNVKIETNTQR